MKKKAHFLELGNGVILDIRSTEEYNRWIANLHKEGRFARKVRKGWWM